MDSGNVFEFSNTIKVTKLKELCKALGNYYVLIRAVASETGAPNENIVQKHLNIA